MYVSLQMLMNVLMSLSIYVTMLHVPIQLVASNVNVLKLDCVDVCINTGVGDGYTCTGL